jgi:hypothetical protein
MDILGDFGTGAGTVVMAPGTAVIGAGAALVSRRS